MSEFYIPNLGIVRTGQPFRLADGRQFNGEWLAGASEEDRAAIGAVPVERGARPVVDERYFRVIETQDAHVISYAAESLPVTDILQRRLTDLAAKRYAVETAGVLLGDAVIRTDEGSQSKINGAYALVQRLPETLVDWKGANGWTQLNAAQMTAIATAAGQHVQACYTAERGHSEALAALAAAQDVEGLIAHDIEDGWPETAPPA